MNENMNSKLCAKEVEMLTSNVPFSLHFTETNINLGFFFWQKFFLHISFDSSQQERSQDL